MIGAADINNLQDLVDDVVKKINEQEKAVWLTKQGAFFISSVYRHSLMMYLNRTVHRHHQRHQFSSSSGDLEDCQGKILTANLSLIGVPPSLKPARSVISTSLLTKRKNYFVTSIQLTFAAVQKSPISKRVPIWLLDPGGNKAYVEEKQVEGDVVDREEDEEEGEENADDRESLDPDDMDKSPILRFLRKLARYFTACHIVTSALVPLVRTGQDLKINVKAVPFDEGDHELARTGGRV
jgi:hypothetical protein